VIGSPLYKTELRIPFDQSCFLVQIAPNFVTSAKARRIPLKPRFRSTDLLLQAYHMVSNNLRQWPLSCSEGKTSGHKGPYSKGGLKIGFTPDDNCMDKTINLTCVSREDAWAEKAESHYMSPRPAVDDRQMYWLDSTDCLKMTRWHITHCTWHTDRRIDTQTSRY
jgi:hypothetical protein